MCEKSAKFSLPFQRCHCWFVEVELRPQSSKTRPRTQKNPRPRTDFLRTDYLKAKDRNSRGQGPKTHRAGVLQANRSSQKKISNFFAKFKRFPIQQRRFLRKLIATFPQNAGHSPKKKGLHKISARSLACSNDEEKNCHDLVPFLTNQKISAVFGRGQDIFENLQASRPRTWPSRPRTSNCILEDFTSADLSIRLSIIIAQSQ